MCPPFGSRVVPRYRKHKPSKQAVVTLDSHDFYLGRHVAVHKQNRRPADAVDRGLSGHFPPYQLWAKHAVVPAVQGTPWKRCDSSALIFSNYQNPVIAVRPEICGFWASIACSVVLQSLEPWAKSSRRRRAPRLFGREPK